MSTATVAKKTPDRIDRLTPGTHVTLMFCNGSQRSERIEPAIFLGIVGEGTDRRAEFVQFTEHPFTKQAEVGETGRGTYIWQAYRYLGTWAYGSSADMLRLVSVIASV
jgi:hypothetical protein